MMSQVFLKRVIVEPLNNNNLSNNEKTAIITRLNSSENIDHVNETANDNIKDFTIETTSAFHGNRFQVQLKHFKKALKLKNLYLWKKRERSLFKKHTKKHNGRQKKRC